jgi:hypothetical protein
MSAGWSRAADPAGSRKDHGRNCCAFRIGDIAAAKTAAAADRISRAAPRAIAIAIARAVIVNPAVKTEAAVVAVAVTAEETTGATTAAAESGDAGAMKAAPAAVKTAVVKTAAVKATAVKATAEAASRVSGSGE